MNKEAYELAKEIADNFIANKNLEGEEIWEEIWVDGKAFDINCYEEDMNMDEEKRTTPVHVSIYPTIERDDGFRDTNVGNYKRLFSYYPNGLIVRYKSEEDDDE
jgi:hypothetical protein